MNLATEAGRFLEGYGLAGASMACCVDALARVTARNAYKLPGGFENYEVVSSGEATEHALALRFLGEFTPPVVRHVLIELDSAWTLCLNNSLPHSFADDGPSLAQRTGARVFRIVDSPGRVWRRGDLREVMSYEARIVTEYGSNGRETKSICAANDGGRWRWFVSGSHYPIEDTFHYKAKKVKERFTSANLRSLLASLGAPAVTVETLMAPARFALLKSPGEPRRTVTREELDDPAYGYYQRGLSWVPHLATHATSILHDFERAVRINPAYEPKVREHLEAAKRILAGQGP